MGVWPLALACISSANFRLKSGMGSSSAGGTALDTIQRRNLLYHGVQFALRQPHVDARSRGRGGCLFYDSTLVRDNRIAALQNPQRAQLRELGGALVERALAPCQGQPH